MATLCKVRIDAAIFMDSGLRPEWYLRWSGTGRAGSYISSEAEHLRLRAYGNPPLHASPSSYLPGTFYSYARMDGWNPPLRGMFS